MSRYYYAPATLRVAGTAAVTCQRCYTVDPDAPVTVEERLLGIYDRLAGSDDAIAYAYSRYYAEVLVGLLTARDQRDVQRSAV